MANGNITHEQQVSLYVHALSTTAKAMAGMVGAEAMLEACAIQFLVGACVTRAFRAKADAPAVTVAVGLANAKRILDDVAALPAFKEVAKERGYAES